MKDFYDLWMLTTNFGSNAMVVETAIKRKFQNSGMELPTEKHTISPMNLQKKMAQWNPFPNGSETKM